MNVSQSDLKAIVRGAYDLQKLRIQMGNRIVANFKAKLGMVGGATEESLDADSQMIVERLRLNYKKITDGVLTFPRQRTFKGNEVISSYTELTLLSQYFAIEKDENDAFTRLKSVLKEFPIYSEFLANVRGVGPAMAGVILSEFNIHVAEYPSSMWKYAGLDVKGGKGRSRQKEHLEESTYIDGNGEEKQKMGITFNPWLKTKLIGVLGSSFVRVGSNPYRDIYDNYKHRLQHMPVHADKSKGHINNMAIRYMVKQFLADLYREWRALEGLPIAPAYAESKLGMTHGSADKYRGAA